jgi:hypothetical protein
MRSDIADLQWPDNSTMDDSGTIPMLVPAPNFEFKVKARDAIIRPWSVSDDTLLPQFIAHELVQGASDETHSPVLSPKGDRRGLFAGEREKLLSIPTGTSDFVSKVPKESLTERSRRRASIIQATVPISVLTFATQALLTASVCTTEGREFNLPLDMSDLQDAWGTSPFCVSPESKNLHFYKRVGPDNVEVNSNKFAYLSEAFQSRKCTGNSAPVMAVMKGLEPEDHFLAGLHTRSPLDEDCG